MVVALRTIATLLVNIRFELSFGLDNYYVVKIRNSLSTVNND